MYLENFSVWLVHIWRTWGHTILPGVATSISSIRRTGTMLQVEECGTVVARWMNRVFMSRQTGVRFLIFSYVIILICSFQSPYQSQTGYSIMPRVSSWLAAKAILFDLDYAELSSLAVLILSTFQNGSWKKL